MSTFSKLCAALLLAVLVAACSKSNSSDTATAPGAPSNNWDSMVWDQGNWG